MMVVGLLEEIFSGGKDAALNLQENWLHPHLPRVRMPNVSAHVGNSPEGQVG